MKKIILSKEISSNLVTRNSLDRFFSKTNKYKDETITIDFDGITFISRSGTDEYLKLKSNSKKKLKEINRLPDVKKMFELVVKNKHSKIEEQLDHPVPVCVI